MPLCKPVLIFRHIACEGPGYLAEVLDRKGIPYRIVRVDRGEKIPASPDDASALVFMGGPMSVNDPLPWVAEEIALIQVAAGNKIPMLGHCLGGQLLARALGGAVTPNPVREMGWLPVEVTPQAMDDPWTRNLPPRFEAFHWHGETFDIPPDATWILQSEHCAHQGFVMDNILAFQCHVEVTADMVREWTHLYADELASPTETVQSAPEMRAHLEARVIALQGIADRLYERWLSHLAE
uniref:GMP synthase - Glutamine amidotransferase n=1 Tax=Candidatus Kentrum sp. FW TaxID=2126338 RepID=A0A450TG99_9GAMM|nr:MAG: GMP synthase - Glutamine amidotransferase [Candidatus Kentron sp. FW]VFJ66248.1 MAG: GMP synthase - Glutamine amidotransferase [Candidatus Kentron sp. FW]